MSDPNVLSKGEKLNVIIEKMSSMLRNEKKDVKHNSPKKVKKKEKN